MRISSGTGFSREGGMSGDACAAHVPAPSRLKPVPQGIIGLRWSEWALLRIGVYPENAHATLVRFISSSPTISASMSSKGFWCTVDQVARSI